MRKQIKIRIQLHSYMRTKQITNSTYMKKTNTTNKLLYDDYYQGDF